MKQILSIKSFAPIGLVIAIMAAFPGLAVADLFVEESTETIPAKTVPAEKPVFTADETPLAVSGERLQLGGNQGRLTVLEVDGKAVDCDAVDVDGGSLSNSYLVNLATEYSDCVYEGDVETSVTMNSCRYRVSELDLYEGEKYADATGAIACQGEDAIEVDIQGGLCPITVPEQQLNDDTELANGTVEGERLLAAGIVGSGLTYSIPAEFGFACETLVGIAGAGTHEDGSLHSDLGLPEVFVEETTKTIPAETIPTGEPVFSAHEFPVDISGERIALLGKQGKLTLIDIDGHTLDCEAVDIDGGTLTAPASDLDLAADYSGCVFDGGSEATPVSMNGCGYRISNLDALKGTGTDGAAEISCGEEDRIEFSVFGVCDVAIPAQALSLGAEVASGTVEGEQRVAAGLRGSGVAYAVSYEAKYDWLCHTLTGLPSAGSYEDGSLQADLMLSGS
jgi:hypothetical protein